MPRLPTASRPRAALAPEGDAAGAAGKPAGPDGVPGFGEGATPSGDDRPAGSAADGSEEAGGPAGRGGRERKAFLLRVSPEVMEELRGWASAGFRSVNAHIEYLLRDALRRRGRSKE